MTTAPFYVDDDFTVHLGDCVDVLRELPDASVDAVCTDPPYGLEFMGAEWDAPWRGDVRQPGDPAFQQGATAFGTVRHGGTAVYGARTGDAGRGFEAWCATWLEQALRVLKPGGHLIAFGGTRMWHRLASAAEDVGFEIRDSLAWLYASGFPKSRDVSEAMEGYLSGQPLPTAEFVVRPGVYEVTAFLRSARDAAGWTNRRIDELFGTNGMAGHWTSAGTQPAVPSVRQWGELKIALGFGNDLDALVAELASTERPPGWGEGTADERTFLSTLAKDPDATVAGGWGTALKPAFEPIVVARRPPLGSTTANVRQLGTGALNIDGCRTAMSDGDRAKFERGSLAWTEHSERAGLERADGSTRKSMAVYGEYGNATSGPHQAGRWPANVILDEQQAEVLDRVSGLASRFFYVPKAPGHERPKLDGDGHPTVKPVTLMRWLVRLVTPPGGVVLEPFSGSGTTAEACVAEGLRCVAIERHEPYARLTVARLSRPIARDLFGAAT